MLFEIEGSSLKPAEPPQGGLPDGVYTALRTYRRDRVVRLASHVRRLNESAALRGLAGVLDEEGVRLGLARAVDAGGHRESRLRLTFAPPRLFVAVEPFVPLPASLYRDGVACVTVPLRRANPKAKDTRFAPLAASAYASLPHGIHEGLMVAPDGSLLEGLSSNAFVVFDGTLWTEDGRVLPGVTRGIVLELAGGVVPIRLEAPRLQDLPAAGECFITSVSRGVLPVVRIDETVLGQGRPGPVTRELEARFDALVEREAQPLGSSRTSP
jgi:branched-chain amino acid aminotransferase